MRVRLLRKLAERIDGVDLSRHAVGDTFSVSAEDARLLIAEGWAVQVNKPTALGLSHVATTCPIAATAKR